MSLKRLGIIAALVSLLTIPGCEKQESDERLVDITVRQHKLQREFGRMAGRIERIERDLDQILALAGKGAGSSGGAVPAKAGQKEALSPGATTTAQRQILNIEETPEYKQLAAATTEIQQQLYLTQGALLKTKEEMDRERRTDHVQQIMALRNPAEMRKRLDALLESFSQKIGNPVQRQEFEADVKQLQGMNFDNLSTEQLAERLASHLRETLDTVQDEGWRRGIGYRLDDLASPRDGDLRRVAGDTRNYVNFLGLRDVMKKHGVSAGDLNDAGLPDASDRPSQSLQTTGDATTFVGESPSESGTPEN